MTTSSPTSTRAAVVGMGPRLAAAALLSSGALMAASNLVQPTFTGGAAQKLDAIESDPLRAGLSAVLFTVGQLPFLVAVVAIAGLVHARSPRLAGTGATLGVLGAFGHALFGGASLTYLLMAGDEAHRAQLSHLVERIESSPVMLTSVVGLLGTVLGLLALSIALFRTRVGPRWVGPVLWLFLLVEFVGSAVSHAAVIVSALLFLVAFIALARAVVARAVTDERADDDRPDPVVAAR
jgi:hypothetical protein